jgi:hypothetical protein
MTDFGGSVGADWIAPALTSAVADEGVQMAANELIASALASDPVRQAVRPILLEAALWGGLAVVAGMWIGRRF